MQTLSSPDPADASPEPEQSQPAAGWKRLRRRLLRSGTNLALEFADPTLAYTVVQVLDLRRRDAHGHRAAATLELYARLCRLAQDRAEAHLAVPDSAFGRTDRPGPAHDLDGLSEAMALCVRALKALESEGVK